ncbi:hypothetical protein UFOVP451_20 [uncultured Caudovirales phage]|uniref:Uncharacterized protein n=1 Tax=uncultured Caudovirales phage TaxID=2100421 RepID=A0A6J5MAV0_9CAUD|nr:hypothetical protein UFOVP451_20 [uncultured Caudovirales phage]
MTFKIINMIANFGTLAIVLLNLITVLQTQKMLEKRKCDCGDNDSKRNV